MNYTIATYHDYNERRYGTPWAAPCDNAGRPCFDGKTGHFSGGRGKGGDLFVEEPAEGSVWAYGQKDYRGKSEKKYAQFLDGAFYPITPADLTTALNNAPQRKTLDETKKLIKALEAFAAQTRHKEIALTADEVKLILAALK